MGITNKDILKTVAIDVPNMKTQLESIVRVDIRQFGIKADRTDQTEKIKTLFTTTLKNFDGELTIPYGVLFNFDEVYKIIPVGMVIFDNSMNSYNSGSYRVKRVGVTSGDTESNDTLFAITNGHHPCLVLNNIKTSGSTSSSKSYNSIMLADGYRSVGSGLVEDPYFMLTGGKNSSLDKYNFSIRAQKLAKSDLRPDSTVFNINEDGKLDVGDTITLTPKSYAENQNTIIDCKSLTGSSQLLLRGGTNNVNILSRYNSTSEIIVDSKQRILFNTDGTTTINSEKRNISTSNVNIIDVTGKHTIFVNCSSVGDLQLDNFLNGQVVTLIFINSNVKMSKSSFKLKGNVDFTPSPYSSITLIKNSSLTTNPIEIGRTEM